MATPACKSLLFDCDASRKVFLGKFRRCGGFLGREAHGRGLRALAPAMLTGVIMALGVAQLAAAPALPRNPAQQDASTSMSGQQQPGVPGSAHPPQETDPMAHHIEERMATRRNDERQKTLVADTDRLLVLAQQLKADVDKSDKNMLSVDVVKRAEQIEKLAHSVKEKMRGN